VRQRRCKDCKQDFANPGSYVNHKRIGGVCRPVDLLPDAGFVMTPNGWHLDKVVRFIGGRGRLRKQ